MGLNWYAFKALLSLLGIQTNLQCCNELGMCPVSSQSCIVCQIRFAKKHKKLPFWPHSCFNRQGQDIHKWAEAFFWIELNQVTVLLQMRSENPEVAPISKEWANSFLTGAGHNFVLNDRWGKTDTFLVDPCWLFVNVLVHHELPHGEFFPHFILIVFIVKVLVSSPRSLLTVLRLICLLP